MDYNEKIQALRNERSEIIENLEANLDEIEASAFDEGMAKADAILKDINRLEKLQNAKSSAGINNMFESKDAQDAVKAFDFGRLIRNLASNRPLDGAEAEMSQEAAKLFAGAGQNPEGTPLPLGLFFNAHTAGAANNGQNLISVNQGDFIESLKKRLVLGRLGVQILQDLNGNLEFGASTTPASPSVKTEVEAAEEYTATLVKRVLSPVRGGVFSKFAKQLMHQTSYNIQQILSDELLAGMAGRAEEHAIQEVLNNAGTTVEIGTNGGAITRAKAIELMNAPDVSNSSGTNNAYITSPAVRAAAMGVAIDSGSGRFLWNEETPERFLGQVGLVTNHVPTDLSKGSADGTLSAMLYGDFSFLTIGFWGGVDLVIDPYSAKKTGEVELMLNFFHDSVVRQPGNFAVIKDILP